MPEILGRLRTPRLAAAPSTPNPGEMYYDTGTNRLLWWDGTKWVPAMDSGGTSYDALPLGSVLTYSGKGTLPQGYVLADGARYTQATFPQGYDFAKAQADPPNSNPLWTYRTTPDISFTVPDLRDKFLYTAGAAAPGSLGGAASVTLSDLQSGVNRNGLTGNNLTSLSHTHGFADGNNGGGQFQGSGYENVIFASGTAWSANYRSNTGLELNSLTHGHALTQRAADQAHENMPPYVTIAQIVKVFGATAVDVTTIQGPPGTAGEKWFTQAGAPASGTGAVGDWALDSGNGDYYEKTAVATWTLRGNLRGAQGVQGPQGIQGTTGPQGPAGQLIGAPIPWLVTAIPSGYREFDGTAIVQATHPQLYALFGATIPDLRGKMMLGVDGTHAIGTTGGEFAHTLSSAEAAQKAVTSGAADRSLDHLHKGGANNLIAHNAQINPEYGGWVGGAGAWGWCVTTGVADRSLDHLHAIAGSAATTAHENTPPYRTVRWITAAG